MEKKISNLELFCVTNKRLSFLENTSYKLAWVGLEKAPDNYLKCDHGDNIFFKEKYYSELTFHFWYWKNKLDLKNDNWIGFCQKRRFWLDDKHNMNLNENELDRKILKGPKEEWNNYDAIICKQIKVNNIKKIKMIKRGYKSLIQNPKIFFNKNRQSIKFHFDMHHGHGNLDKAINVMNDKDRNEFREFVNENISFNPHIMFISKGIVLERWFGDLFSWLFECEKIFSFKSLRGYDTTRLYAFLAERYLSFWFKKYTKSLEWDWFFYESK